MKEEDFNFLKALARYSGSPRLIAWWVLAALSLGTILVDAFSLPLTLVFVSGLVFLGLVVFVTYGLLILAHTTTLVGFSRRELNALIQNSKDGILIYDPAFKILELNQAAEEILALKAADVLNHTISPALLKMPEFKIITQVIFPSLAPTVNQISEGGWPQIVDINLEEPSLKLKTVLSRIEDGKGRILGFIKSIHDETREAEAVAAKNEFITTAAHQLRTPLTAIRWTFETLTQEKVTPEFKSLSADGLKLTERSLDIINDLLDVAKIEEGRFDYRFEDINLNEFVARIIDQEKTLSEAYGVKIYFSADKNFIIKADPEKLSMALANLIDNAIKYNTKNGSVAIGLETTTENTVKISIKDSGVGIPNEEIKKLFTKFHRGQNVVQLEPNGNGLGLYITKNIIEGHGGKITVDSVLGRGTTFLLTLPLESVTDLKTQ